MDTTAPTVTVVNPAGGSRTKDPTPTLSGVAGNAEGDSSTVTVRLYAGSSASGTPLHTLSPTRSGSSWSVNTPSTLAEGTYTVQAEQDDSVAHLGQSAPNTFAVDLTAPALTLASPANGSATSDTSPTLSGVAGDAAGDSDTVTVNVHPGTTTNAPALQQIDVTRSGGSWSADAATLMPGTYTAQAKQDDSAGHSTQSGANTFTITEPGTGGGGGGGGGVLVEAAPNAIFNVLLFRVNKHNRVWIRFLASPTGAKGRLSGMTAKLPVEAPAVASRRKTYTLVKGRFTVPSTGKIRNSFRLSKRARRCCPRRRGSGRA